MEAVGGSSFVGRDARPIETMDHVEYAHTRGLGEAEVEGWLHSTGTGVLTYTDRAEADATPPSHYYDGQRLYFRFGTSPDGEQGRIIETTETASYLLYGAEPTDSARTIDAWRVHVAGASRERPEER